MQGINCADSIDRVRCKICFLLDALSQEMQSRFELSYDGTIGLYIILQEVADELEETAKHL